MDMLLTPGLAILSLSLPHTQMSSLLGLEWAEHQAGREEVWGLDVACPATLSLFSRDMKPGFLG